ncbi:MAG TPA: tetratricopeptide repeat protein [Bacteroidia bacterium]|nr:tetratricopeptide repeat protein [Bacteroidia bacterium]
MTSIPRKITTHHILLAASLLTALIIYYRFLFFGHISWDDPEMVFKNKFVKTFDLKELATNHFIGNYIPVTMLVHAFAWLFFGSNDAGHHAINILFHLLNALLVYQAGKQLLKNDTGAIAGMIVFLLHPVQMESVGWISELKNILSTTFYLSGFLVYIKYVHLHEKKQYLFCLLLFLFGCFCKSSVVVFPLALICADIYIQKKISLKFLTNKIPFLLISVVIGLINIKAQTEDQFINYAHAFPYYQRVGFAGFALLKYLLMFIAPLNLSVIYPYPLNSLPALFTGYITLGGLAFLFYLAVKKNKYDLLALGLFTLVNLILVLQFVPFGEVLYADRYMYIPVIGFAWIFASMLPNVRLAPLIVVPILLIALGLASFSRSNVWKSGISLYEDILKQFPNSFVALNSVGVEYMLKDQNEKALYFLNRSVEVAPYNYKGFYNKGLFYLKNQKPAKAVENFDRAIEIYRYSKAYVGRASAYHQLGDVPSAMRDANSALAIEKNNPKAHFVLGNCYNDLNKTAEALAEYNTCIKLNDSEPDFYFQRAIIFGKTQDFIHCVEDMNTCLAMDPTHYEAYYWRGVAKVNLKINPCEDFRIGAQNNHQPSVNAFRNYCK